MCNNCGNYRGKQVVDIASKTRTRVKRRQDKQKALGHESKKETNEDKASGEAKPLTAEALSAKKK
jgi:ribosomal protein L32